MLVFFFFQAEDGIRDVAVTGVQTCALPILIGLARGLELVKSKAGEIKASFVNHDGRNRASPPERADIVLRSEANIFKGPISPVDAGQVHKVSASKELVCTQSVVSARIVLVAAARIGFGEVEEAPVRRAIWPVADGLTNSDSRLIPRPQWMIVGVARTCNKGATISLRESRRDPRRDSGCAENLGGDAVRLGLLDVFFKGWGLQLHTAADDCIGLTEIGRAHV